MAPGEDDLIIPPNCVRDLGVMVDNELSFKSHIDYVYWKTRKRINLLLWAFNLRKSFYSLEKFQNLRKIFTPDLT